MITRIPNLRQAPAWRQILAQAITDPAHLCELLDLDPLDLAASRQASASFPLRVPQPYLNRMRKGDPNDPLLRQVLPIDQELESSDGFVADPVGDLSSVATPGLLHKYHGRALVITTGACAVHCRYCFRRHFPYSDHARGASIAWPRIFAYLREHPEIDELILSGGDPLMLSDRRLRQLVDSLTELPQLRRLRIHTRLPIVIPQRVDQALLAWIEDCRLSVVMVVHANHAQELDREVCHALDQMRRAGARLFNQSVLLRGINDQTDSLARLSEALFETGVQPYYLHLLDPVAGAAHFDVNLTHARTLMRELERRLPGYLVPRLVREFPGAAAKTLQYSGA